MNSGATTHNETMSSGGTHHARKAKKHKKVAKADRN
jgi:hypothetical protein